MSSGPGESARFLVVPGDDGSKVVVLPLSSRNSGLHHEAVAGSVTVWQPQHFHSLDLLERSTASFWDAEVDKGNRQEPAECVDLKSQWVLLI